MPSRHGSTPLVFALALALALTLALALPAAGQRAMLERAGNSHQITLSLPSVPSLDTQLKINAVVPVSVELPMAVSDTAVEAMASLKNASHVRGPLERMKLHRYPPGPDHSTRWFTFAITSDHVGDLRLEIDSPKPFTFARIIIGDPFSPQATLLGAFSEANRIDTKEIVPVIEPGEDMLGTLQANQRVRVPAGFLHPDAEAFDQMVHFGEAAFMPEDNNVDTVMVRTEAIPVGGTTPVRLLKFANRSVRPVTIPTTTGKPLRYHIEVGESHNVESSGFITILPNGSYQSTMRLAPVFAFHQVDKQGNPVAPPIIVDSGLINIPGFPFWLASDGGRWTGTAPEGRLVTPASSNFFYENGQFQRFIHSNGPGGGKAKDFEQQLAECLKSNAEAVN